jgi:starvation-inducible DNA-binding protein
MTSYTNPQTVPDNAASELGALLKSLLADVFALYLKTKNFHWHMTGPHFRDYHLLLDEHADQLFAMTDEIAERARKIGTDTLRSIGDIARHQRIQDSDEPLNDARQMLSELLADNRQLLGEMREVHEACDRLGDVATASLVENWIDEAEKRAWFLAQSIR